MSSVEFLIIYIGLGHFFAIYILYRAMASMREIIVAKAKVLITFHDLLSKMNDTMELQSKVNLKIVKALDCTVIKQEDEFKWIRNELASMRGKTDEGASGD